MPGRCVAALTAAVTIAQPPDPMLILPLRTDRRLSGFAWVNTGLLVVNFIMFALTHTEAFPIDAARFEGWRFDPRNPYLHQFLTYQFIHGSFMHLAGNMIFLHVFGPSIEDRMGSLGYLAFYLAGGVMAALGHAMASSMPVVGASGSIAAVTGAFLVMMPRTRILIFYWLIFLIGFFEIPAMLLILFQVAQNLIFSAIPDGSPVAYEAHLAGYAFGFVVAMGLLRFKLLPREREDLLTALEHHRRRQQFKRMVQQHGSPWEGSPGGSARPEAGAEPAAAVPREVRAEEPAPNDPNREAVMQQRSKVYSLLSEHKLDEAAQAYMDLLGLDEKQVLSQQAQLDVGSKLMADGRYEEASRAFERFLEAYPGYPQREQIELMAGLIYARYLLRPDRARELLERAMKRLREGEEKELAERTLRELAE